MFKGIIDATEIIEEEVKSGINVTFLIKGGISNEPKIDQRNAHNSVCLTVEKVLNGFRQLNAIEETLSKTNLNCWKKRTAFNLDPCMIRNGHLVLGHVDDTAIGTITITKDGSWENSFTFPPLFASHIIEKRSITLNDISLTIFNVTDHSFAKAINPYAFEQTNV